MIQRLLWTICYLLVILIKVQANPNRAEIYTRNLSLIEDGLKRMDSDISTIQELENA